MSMDAVSRTVREGFLEEVTFGQVLKNGQRVKRAKGLSEGRFS